MHYVIGDVHGCYDEMMRLLQKIEAQDKDAIIYFVGDFIDRGPKVWETLQWVMENISMDGKYRSVMGNHEAMVCEWFDSINDWEQLEWEAATGLTYGFGKVLKEHQWFTREKIYDIAIFFKETLPLSVTARLKTVSGQEVSYIIAHAYAPHPEQLADMELEEEKYIYLWERRHMWGFHGAKNQILVHGHTPTIHGDYILRNPKSRPGMIVHNRNCINVDSGCCYFYTGEGRNYPCLLSAICLETLEEFYSDTVEERFEEYIMRTKPALLNVLTPKEAAKLYEEQFWEDNKRRGYESPPPAKF